MKDELIARLVELTRSWNQNDDVPEAQQNACKDIGAELYKRYGHEGMQDAYYDAKGRNRYAGVIAAYWHGIGNWKW